MTSNKKTETIEIAVLRARGNEIDQGVKDAVNVVGDFAGVFNPWLGISIKSVALLGGWLWNRRKYERAKPILSWLKGQVEGSGEGAYVRKEECADLFEDALHRIADQPDEHRRNFLCAIVRRVMAEPREHAENKLFLRFADELSGDVLRMLFSLKKPVAQTKHNRIIVEYLQEHLSLDTQGASENLAELVSLQLVSEKVHKAVPSQGKSLDHLLTRKGRAFVDYCQST